MSESLNYYERLDSLKSLKTPTLEQLFVYLGDQDPSVIVTALKMIEPKPTPFLKDPLFELSTHVNPSIRCCVLSVAPYTLQQQSSIELIQKALKDDNSDVRLTALTSVQVLLDQVTMEQFFSLATAVIDMMNDPEWRVRSSVQLMLPQIVSYFGLELSERVVLVLKCGMKDASLEVRKQTVQSMADIVEMFRVEWGKSYITPLIILFYTHPNYKIRQSTLAAMVEVGYVMGKDAFTTSFLPMILNLAFDVVPNVRLTVLQQLRVLISKKFLDIAIVNSRVAPCVETLAKDTDEDVVAMANNLKPLLNTE
uniref:Protein phosphatase PP2A regulatory subunit A, putative n=1 Tax=Entamoeba invadens TaxID=33085 RepID=S0B0X4_ENTIV|nr:protein phosphatase PP2A regulatory subunit A, putative [Entamoeba invadens]